MAKRYRIKQRSLGRPGLNDILHLQLNTLVLWHFGHFNYRGKPARRLVVFRLIADSLDIPLGITLNLATVNNRSDLYAAISRKHAPVQN